MLKADYTYLVNGKKITAVNANNVVKDNIDYYLFGLKRVNPAIVTSSNRCTYNGKEYQNFFDIEYLDYGARFYDPTLGNWNVVNPLTEDYPFWTQYHFCHNNPIVLINSYGRSADWHQSESGALLWKEENKKKIIVNEEQFKNFGTTASIDSVDWNYINFYQNVPVPISNAPVHAQEIVLKKDGLKGMFLSRNSPLSEKSQLKLLTANIHKEQQNFIDHPVTKANVNTLFLVANGVIEGVTDLGGTEVSAIGNYWYPINPMFYDSQYRNLTGLPNSNTGAFTLKAALLLRIFG